MAIMPLIDLMLTGVEWLPGGVPHPALALYLALSFVNGCVLEIGRKLWAPDSEREGVETYSALWGPAPAARVWTLCVAAAAALLALTGAALGIGWAASAVATAGVAAAAILARRYAAAPTKGAEKTLDLAAGLWVLVSYATLGFLPLVLGGGP
jgi:4-hydroxybenzoate polyprenyltransferase